MVMMSLDKTFLVGTCFQVYLLNAVIAELIVKPQNTLVELGIETSLMCCSKLWNSTIEWKLQKWNNGELFDKLCSGKHCQSDGHSIDSQRLGCSRLVVNSSYVEVAGLYQCSELGTEAVAGAYLIVYQLNCSHNFTSKTQLVEGIRAVFTCTTLWKGKLSFQIKSNGKEIDKILDSQRQGVYSISVPVDLVRPLLPSYTFSIQLITAGITDENIDRNSPVVNWSSTEEQVMYRVSNIRTNCPKRDCTKVKGDVVICSADGFPDPKFQWLNWDLKPVANGSDMLVKDVGSFEFTCVAKNTINGLEYEVRERIVVTVDAKAEGMSQLSIIILAIGVLIIFILVILLVSTLFIMYTVLRIVKVYFSDNGCTDRRVERGVRMSELQNNNPSLSSVQVEDFGRGDHYSKEASEESKATDRCLPHQQVVDAEFDTNSIEEESRSLLSEGLPAVQVPDGSN